MHAAMRLTPGTLFVCLLTVMTATTKNWKKLPSWSCMIKVRKGAKKLWTRMLVENRSERGRDLVVGNSVHLNIISCCCFYILHYILLAFVLVRD